jgi:hypothetical protein
VLESARSGKPLPAAASSLTPAMQVRHTAAYCPNTCLNIQQGPVSAFAACELGSDAAQLRQAAVTLGYNRMSSPYRFVQRLQHCTPQYR